ncbi:MAG: hypothetical protein ACFCUU_07250 [Cyclobacteriaceae bacterium]
MDTDLKELVYKSLKRAVVVEKDIPDYRPIWKKHRIYVANEYQTDKSKFVSQSDWDNSVSYLNPNEIPFKINDVNFCLKSEKELQQISDRTWEDFLHLSFSLIKIEGNKATIQIDNTWIVSKHSKKVYLGGGGYECVYKKTNGVWEFEKIISTWIS